MSDSVPSKELSFSWTWDASALNWKISTVDMGDGMEAGYEHLAGYYERRLIEEIERLQRANAELLKRNVVLSSAHEPPAKHGPCPNCGAKWVSAELSSSQAELPKPINHDLWRHLHDEHGLTLLQSELDEILRLAQPPVPDHFAEMKRLLLDQPWHAKCEIIPDYMPPYPRPETRPSVQVRFNDGTEYPPFLRYSAGPKQGFFWDMYGEDMQSIPLAVLALSQAPYPRSVGPIKFTIPFPSSETKGASDA